MVPTYNNIKKYFPEKKPHGKSSLLEQVKVFPKSSGIDDIFENQITLRDPFSYFYYLFSYANNYYIIPIHLDVFDYLVTKSDNPFAEIVLSEVPEPCFMYSHSVFFQDDNYKMNVCREYFSPLLFVEMISNVFYLAHVSNWTLSQDFDYNKNNHQILISDNLTRNEKIFIEHIKQFLTTAYSFINTHEYVFEFFKHFGETDFSFPAIGYFLGMRTGMSSNFIIDYFGIDSGVIKNAELRKSVEFRHCDDYEICMQDRKPEKYSINYSYFYTMFSYVDISISHHLLINSFPESSLENPLYDEWFKLDGVHSLIINRKANTLEFCGFTSISSVYDQNIADFGIKNVIFGEGIESIDNYVLTECRYVESVKLPNSLKLIGDDFCRESGIRKIVFPPNLREVGDNCLRESDIEEIEVISKDLKTGDNFVLECYKLHTFNMKEGKLRLGDSFLSICESLGTIVLPPMIKKIPNRFMSRSNMSSFVMPKHVEEIGDEFGLRSIHPETIELPECLESIGNVFLYRSTIRKITIPASVDKIGDLFMIKSKLHKLYFEKESLLRKIGDDFLRDSHELTKIRLGNNIASIGNNFAKDTGLTKLELPKNLYSVGDNFMANCKSLVYIRFHNLLESAIDSNFLINCPSLRYIYYRGNDNDKIPYDRILGVNSNVRFEFYNKRHPYKEARNLDTDEDKNL